MTAASRDDRRYSAARGGLREIVMAVRRFASQRDEYRSTLDRACIDADAADVAPPSPAPLR